MNVKKIKTWRDPYETGFSTCRAREIEIKEGLTVLVGCNGSGKTTLIHNIREILRKEDIPFIFYDNLHDGGGNAASSLFYNDEIGIAAALWTASEGECININMGVMSTKLRGFLQDGTYIKDKRSHALAQLFRSDDEKEKEVPDERWLLLDAVDSGLSIDNVIDLKGLFDLLIKESEKLGIALYIVIAANEYELVNGSNCMDVTTGKYLQFKDYDDFRKFIIKSREKKDRRIENANRREAKKSSNN